MKWRALLVELPPVCVETKWMDGPRRRHVAVSTIIVIVQEHWAGMIDAGCVSMCAIRTRVRAFLILSEPARAESCARARVRMCAGRAGRHTHERLPGQLEDAHPLARLAAARAAAERGHAACGKPLLGRLAELRQALPAPEALRSPRLPAALRLGGLNPRLPPRAHLARQHPLHVRGLVPATFALPRLQRRRSRSTRSHAPSNAARRLARVLCLEHTRACAWLPCDT